MVNHVQAPIFIPITSASTENTGNELTISSPLSGYFRNKNITLANGSMTKSGQDKAAAHQEGFLSTLESAGYSVINLSFTLFTAVTSALKSTYHIVTNIATPPSVSTPEHWISDKNQNLLGAGLKAPSGQSKVHIDENGEQWTEIDLD